MGSIVTNKYHMMTWMGGEVSQMKRSTSYEDIR